MRLVSLTGAESVNHPEHGSATVGSDGVFDVPDGFGQFLLRAKAQWCTEADKLARDARAALRDLANPKKAVQVLADVRARVVELEQQVRDLLEGKPEPVAEPVVTQPAGEPPVAVEKTPRPRKPRKPRTAK